MNESKLKPRMSTRFRSYLPVVVDIETAGFNAKTDAMLEFAAVIIKMDETGKLYRGATHSAHIEPFPGANLDPKSLEFTGIDPYHPFRMAKPEGDALRAIFQPIRQAIKDQNCTRAIMVAHNPVFDIAFLNAAIDRNKIKRSPFHQFSSFDTATLGGLAYGQTVLAKVAKAAGMQWDNERAHSAIYDAEQTAELFCTIINRWDAVNASVHSDGPRFVNEA